ncbi:MAG: helix-turn-helix transcriptional regulator [Leptolyngbya sp. UWPOB_LEPTO1]|uniref:helix-turn-helix domain-containing protein n=1 Tax=Leptolyngbya sp. UWPOB_LEPTO1 TaxID=2815653 RepID=UPI001AC05AC7|nr:helix-turn-helix transcriptional regulator [Leptolyngbya sp. UWPOB_LEPTO1]MBN8561104.1 helix-turn-helix transcriptional regulator [Leptolyngbya sp. UWPOB_LEPTO1]
MKFANAFRETLFRFDLTGLEIAEKTGLTTTQISHFRNGVKNLRVDSIEKILDVLTQEQREYMLNLVAKAYMDETIAPATKQEEE